MCQRRHPWIQSHHSGHLSVVMFCILLFVILYSRKDAFTESLASFSVKLSLNGLADIRDHLFGMSKDLGLPIVIETVVEKVIRLYKYVGFEIYHEWYDKDADLNVRFLKKGEKQKPRIIPPVAGGGFCLNKSTK